MTGLPADFSFQDAYSRRRLPLSWWIEQLQAMLPQAFFRLRDQIFMIADMLTRNSTSGYVRTGRNLYLAVAMRSLDLGCRDYALDAWERSESIRIAETLAGLLFDAMGSHESSLEMRNSWSMWREHSRRPRIVLT